jgi:hypothetical protein
MPWISTKASFAGKNLPKKQLRVLERAKEELRIQFGKA